MSRSGCRLFAIIACIALLILTLSNSFFLEAANGSIDELFVGNVKEVILEPIADSYIDSAYPDENYGEEEVLKVATKRVIEGETRGEQYSYLMFDLSGIPPDAKIRYATLSIGLKKMSGRGIGGYISISAHFCPDNSWNERKITWNNKPEFVKEVTDSWGFAIISFAARAHFEIAEDVQRALVDGGRLTEVITWGSGSGYAVLRSREGRSSPSLTVGYITPPFNVVDISSSQDTGETSNLGYICLNTMPKGAFDEELVAEEMESAFCEFAITLPKKVNMNPTNYTIAYVRGYSFLRWETSGDVYVEDPSDRVTTLMVKGDGTLKAIGSSSLIEYGYSELDGASEKYGSAGQAFFVRFTPMFSGYLKTARFYFTSISKNTTRNEIKIHVMDENRVDMITPITVKPVSESTWLDVDLSSYNLAVVKGVDFYVGLELTTHSYPVLGIDYDYPDNRSLSRDVRGRWKLDKNADYMIRAVVETAEVPVTKTPTPTSIATSTSAPSTPATPRTRPTTILTTTTTAPTMATKSMTTQRETTTLITTVIAFPIFETLMLYTSLTVLIAAILVVTIYFLMKKRS